MTDIVNAFSIDVEDWFQVAAFAGCIERSSWDSLECRVERNVDALLQTLDQRGVKATFFTLGWMAQRYPDMVRRIVNAGHELASHGHGHHMIGELGPERFREDVVRAKGLLESLSGIEVIGYRAPSFSVGRDTLWALDILAETGHRYSSSIYPIQHDLYGMPEAPRFAHARSGLLEIPATSLRLGDRNFPASGGGYFRLLPYRLSRWSIERVNRVDREAAVFYCHPWEIDPQQPRVAGAPLKSRFRHYVNQSRMLGKIDRLLGDFPWNTVRDTIVAQALPELRSHAKTLSVAPQ
jgi:polysaccharide deacetylase family protein (PEP-CTERM system associated)